jgi:cell division protein FtsA
MPMYSTCIGLILKGYNDYENTVRAAEIIVEKEVVARKVLVDNQVEIVPAVEETLLTEAKTEVETEKTPVEVKPRKTIKDFMDSIKNNLIEMFQEEEDSKL